MAAPWTQDDLQTTSQSNDSDSDDVAATEESVTGSDRPYTAATTPGPGQEATGMDPNAWGVWWPLHRYGLGSLFVLLCVYALYATVLRACRNRAVGSGARSRRSVQPVFTAINLLVFLLGLSNAFMLLVDPYRLYNRVPLLMAVLLLNTPYPCMTSAFALVNWVLLSISRMRMTRASKLRSAWFLTLMILTHFSLILAACLVLVLVSPVLVLGILCHGFFVVFGVFLCLTYVYSAWKIIGAERNTRKMLHDISTRDCGGSRADSSAGSVSKSPRSLSGKIPQRLASAIGRNKSKRAPPASLDNSTAKIFTIGEDDGVQQTNVPAPLSITENGGQDESVMVTGEETDTQIRDMADEKRLLSADHNGSSSPLKQYSNAAMTGGGHAVTGTGPQNGAPADGKTVSGGGHGRTPATASNRSTYAKAPSGLSGGKISGSGKPQKSTQKVFRIAAITAAIGIAASGLGLYGILGLMVAAEENKPSPWGWYAFQTCSRLIELSMGCTMAYFTTQPFPRRRQR